MISKKLSEILDKSGLCLAGISLCEHGATVSVTLKNAGGDRYIGSAKKNGNTIESLNRALENALSNASPGWFSEWVRVRAEKRTLHGEVVETA